MKTSIIETRFPKVSYFAQYCQSRNKIIRESLTPNIVSLFLRGFQAPISMRLGARQTGTQFALLASLGATSGATDRECYFLLDFHVDRMHSCAATRCSIVTTARGQF